MKRRLLIVAVALTGIRMLHAQAHPANPEQGPYYEANFVDGYIDVESVGVGPERLPRGSESAYADARRAAYVLASRELAERLAGMYLDSTTSLNDQGRTEFTDQVRAELKRTKVPGGEIRRTTSEDEFHSTNRVRMLVRFELSTALPMLMNAIGPRLREVERTKLRLAPTPPRADAAIANFDALIVKVPAGFKPSISPKLFNGRGELVYGSDRLAADVLISQGIAAQFTTTEARAKAALEAHGAKQPLVVSGFLHSGDKDVDLSNSDAERILRENASGNFLEKGRVFIVIGPAS
jgi:hypothetical protein